MNKTTPVFQNKDQVIANYNRLSAVYDIIAGPSEKKFKDIGLKMFDAKAGEILLEIGYGTGYCLVEFANKVGALGEIVGVEISNGMQTIAKKKIKKANYLDRVKFIEGDATCLEFDDGIFDGIFMSFVLELFDSPEIPIVLAECMRVLKPGGRIGLVSLSRTGYPSLPLKVYEWAHLTWPVLIDCRPIYPLQSLNEAGYEIVETQDEKMWGLPVEIVLGKKTQI